MSVEVIRVWSEWRDGAVPTSEEATQAVIFYGEHDSYQPHAQVISSIIRTSP